MSPVSPGCHVSTASRCPPASSGGQRCPPVFRPVNMAGNMPWYFSEGTQPLAPGSGIPPAAARSLPGVNKIGSFPARPDVAPGGALLPSRRATPGFGTGGTIRTRTGGLVIPNHARFLCATAPCGRAIGISYRTAAVFPMRHRSFPVAGSSFRSVREQKKEG